MALSRTPHAIGTQRRSRVGLGRFSVQPRAAVAFDPGALVVGRSGSTLGEIPDPAAARPDLVLFGTFVGTCVFTASSTADANGGAIGSDGKPETITVEPLSGEGTGDFSTGSGAHQITSADRDAPAFMYDNDTYYRDDAGGTLSFGGWVADVNDAGKVMIKHSAQLRVLYELYSAGQATPGYTADDSARLVATNIPAGTFATGVFTVTATGVFPTQDGVAGPLVVGQKIIFPVGTITTQVVSAANSGPYEVVTVGATGVSAVFARPAKWAHGAIITPETTIRVGSEGTLFKGNVWYADPATAAKVVGTDDPVLYPRSVTQAIILVAGHVAVINVPIKHATGKTNFLTSRLTANTCTLTVGGYHPLSITAGGIGTATVDMTGCVAAGTINVADVSTLLLTITQ